MSYDVLFEVLDDREQLISFVKSMDKSSVNVPYVVSEVLAILNDNSPFRFVIPDTDKIGMIMLAKTAHSVCFDIMLDEKKLDTYLKYGKIETYEVVAANGLRPATDGEVKNGIEGLIPKYIYPAGEEAYKNICLVWWMITGRSYYFRQAGYKLEYNSDGKPTTSFYEMIQMSYVDIADTFQWMNDRARFEKALKIMDKSRKSGGFKYAMSAKDEIFDDVSVKQLIKNIDEVFPRNSEDIDYRKARALVYKTNKQDARLTPLEISELRRIYRKFATTYKEEKKKEESVNVELKEKCERILKFRYTGLIDQKHFAYTIISTLKKNNYSRCSEKQMRFIEDAIAIIDKATGKEVEEKKSNIITEDEIDDSLAQISMALAQGVFET